MLHFYYKWRYRRKQTTGAFKLPTHRLGGHSFKVNFSSYLADATPKSRSPKGFDRVQSRRRRLRSLLWLLALLGLGWLVYESIAALSLFRN